MELVDIGVNLGHRSFHGDRDAVVARARAAGVGTLIITGTNLESSRSAIALARGAASGLYATCGVHPHDAGRSDDRTLAELRLLAAAPEVVAIGECGLDYNRDFSPRPAQQHWLGAQIELALERGLPLFFHERDAHAEFIRIVDRYATGGRLAVPAVVHCFTGDAAALEAYLARGFYIGITGWICDERRGLGLQQLARQIPLARLLIETDAPFLLPRDLPRTQAPTQAAVTGSSRGRNEPAWLPHIARTLAACRDESAETIAAATTRNARALFRLPAVPAPPRSGS